MPHRFVDDDGDGDGDGKPHNVTQILWRMVIIVQDGHEHEDFDSHYNRLG